MHDFYSLGRVGADAGDALKHGTKQGFDNLFKDVVSCSTIRHHDEYPQPRRNSILSQLSDTRNNGNDSSDISNTVREGADGKAGGVQCR